MARMRDWFAVSGLLSLTLASGCAWPCPLHVGCNEFYGFSMETNFNVHWETARARDALESQGFYTHVSGRNYLSSYLNQSSGESINVFVDATLDINSWQWRIDARVPEHGWMTPARSSQTASGLQPAYAQKLQSILFRFENSTGWAHSGVLEVKPVILSD